MSTKTLIRAYAVTFLGVSLPFALVHLLARPDDAPISPLQHASAALANLFGPWGVALVRLVDFPNAGLRSFSWPLAIGLTLLAAALVAVPLRIGHRHLRLAAAVVWALFTIAWLGIGFVQIADGLL